MYGKVWTWGFQKVQAHFGGLSVSRAIRDWNRSLLLKIIKNHDLWFSIIFDKIDRFQSRIAWLTDHARIVRTISLHRVQAHFGGWSVSWAIRDQTSSDFFENLLEILKILKIKILKIAIKLIDFNRELLSSQATHRNGSVLFEILRTISFNRV